MKPTFIIFILIFAVIMVLALIRKKQHSQDREYDERERLVRGEAYRYAFTAIVLFAAFHVFALLLLGHPLMADGVSSLLGIFLAIAVFAVYCIRNNAFKTMRTSSGFRSYSILLIIVVGINTWSGIMSARDGSLLEDGILQTPVSSFACAACFLVVLIAMIMQNVANKKEETA